ncbi:Hypothetical predicted protein [Cloeon dipterum]|uniref:Uncharacterized protein n=1 Tax=Cloeon dipterum TaxID=197152 RepID=A0A8S1CMV1_9INSE|nr:Hypothetical predicted protein [Cloeon dipterum]
MLRLLHSDAIIREAATLKLRRRHRCLHLESTSGDWSEDLVVWSALNILSARSILAHGQVQLRGGDGSPLFSWYCLAVVMKFIFAVLPLSSAHRKSTQTCYTAHPVNRQNVRHLLI